MTGNELLWRTGLVMLLLLAVAIAVTWWVSSPGQRAAYRTLLGIEPAQEGLEESAEAGDGSGAAISSGEGVPRRAMLHTRPGGLSCRAPTRDVDEVDPERVFQWYDEAGRPVFSDRPPGGVSARDLSARYTPEEQFARLTIDNRDSRFHAELRTVLREDVTRMSRFLRAALELPLRQVDLTITMYGSAEALRGAHRNRGAPAPELAGLYRHGSNRVAIADQADFEATRRVARHEMSHALLAGSYGITPLWLNEGLAEVMEPLELAGQTRRLTANPRHTAPLREQFRRDRPGVLRALLELDAQAWRRLPPEKTYARAWALMHELLSHEAGRSLLRAVLALQQARPCAELDSVALVDAHYPGGVAALERRWQRRMREGRWKWVALE